MGFGIKDLVLWVREGGWGLEDWGLELGIWCYGLGEGGWGLEVWGLELGVRCLGLGVRG